MNRRVLASTVAVAALLLAAKVQAQPPPAEGSAVPRHKLMTWSDLLSRPKPETSIRIPYGADPNQFAQLWQPDGEGPHPVVLMIHGGCWLHEVADLDIMNWVAEDLRRRGWAVWNIEYRRVDQPGGGYPNTFRDVAEAAGALRRAATVYRLDLSRVVALGHSAGGHLALWLAARAKLAPTDPTYVADPLPLAGVVSTGGLPDLAAARAMGDEACGIEPIDKLVGSAGPGRPDPYADTSPIRMLPTRVPVTLIHGAEDHIAPVALGESFVAEARKAGQTATLVVIPDSGHVELVTPDTAAWNATVEAVVKGFGTVVP